MSASLDDAEFWLPLEFLTDDDLATDKNNKCKSKGNGFCSDTEATRSLFPFEFPYVFGSFGTSSDLCSLVEASRSCDAQLMVSFCRMLCFEKLKIGLGEVSLVVHGEACVVVPSGVVLEVGGGGLSGNGAGRLVIAAEEAHSLFKSWAKLDDSNGVKQNYAWRWWSSEVVFLHGGSLSEFSRSKLEMEMGRTHHNRRASSKTYHQKINPTNDGGRAMEMSDDGRKRSNEVIHKAMNVRGLSSHRRII